MLIKLKIAGASQGNKGFAVLAEVHNLELAALCSPTQRERLFLRECATCEFSIGFNVDLSM